MVNPLNVELNPICHLLALLGAHHILHISRIRVKVLCYKSEDRWFDLRWCHLNFSLTNSFRSHYGPGVDSASNRNDYQEYFLGVKAVGA